MLCWGWGFSRAVNIFPHLACRQPFHSVVLLQMRGIFASARQVFDKDVDRSEAVTINPKKLFLTNHHDRNTL